MLAPDIGGDGAESSGLDESSSPLDAGGCDWCSAEVENPGRGAEGFDRVSEGEDGVEGGCCSGGDRVAVAAASAADVGGIHCETSGPGDAVMNVMSQLLSSMMEGSPEKTRTTSKKEREPMDCC